MPQSGKDNLAEVEGETLGKVARTVSSIDNAISLWGASRLKPKELGSRILRLRKFRESLVKWQVGYGRALRQGIGMEGRALLLRDFIEVCYSYENS